MAAILELRHGTKEYRGVPAVKDVSVALEEGEVHALLGENGAGKSTLTKMLAGVVTPTAGEILLDGQPVELRGPSDALRKGIAMVSQETSLVPSLTAAQKDRRSQRLNSSHSCASRMQSSPAKQKTHNR